MDRSGKIVRMGKMNKSGKMEWINEQEWKNGQDRENEQEWEKWEKNGYDREKRIGMKMDRVEKIDKIILNC